MLYTLVDGVRVLAVLLASVLPESSARMLAAVGAPDGTDWEAAVPGGTAAGTPVGIDAPLFPRVEERLTG